MKKLLKLLIIIIIFMFVGCKNVGKQMDAGNAGNFAERSDGGNIKGRLFGASAYKKHGNNKNRDK